VYKSVLNKDWRLKEASTQLINRYMQMFSLGEVEARILATRGIEEEHIADFLDPKLRKLLPDPFHLIDMDKAVNRIVAAILSNQRICIFGDYDVDGATSSALLKKFLSSLESDVEVYIPDRMKEGYGPSPEAMVKLHKNGIKLVVTVDCGAMSYNAIDAANTLGMDVIVIDHHICADILPKAFAIINPNRLDETTQYKYLAAVGVSFLFAIAIATKLKKDGFFESKKIELPDMLEYLDIVALGTVCDVMPLIGLNRAFVKQGLKMMAQRKNIGLKALSDIASIDTMPSCYHLGFVLGPRINAGGRVGESYLGSHLLSTKCEIEALELAKKLEDFNLQRRFIESNIIEEAIKFAQLQAEDNCIMISGNWHPGVIGIIAGKLKERYSKPIAVVSVIDGVGKASCRSVYGVDFGRTLAEAKIRGLIEVGGGHAMAAGFTAKEETLPQLKAFLNEEFSKYKNKILENKICEFDLELTSNGMSVELYNKIHSLAPFGNGNTEPIVKLDGLYVLKAYIVGEKHISCLLVNDRSSFAGKAVKAIAFNAIGTEIEHILFSEKPLNFSAIGQVKLQHKHGDIYAQLVIQDLLVGEEV
jgi:single-stranded-DNA-specific exonuclease